MRIQDLDFHVDLLRTILWQYQNAPNLIGLVSEKEDWYNKNIGVAFKDWHRDVFNVDTANDFGLNVWARILDVKFGVDLQPVKKRNWGFGVNNLNFGNGNFGRLYSSLSYLTLDQKRFIIRLRYFTLAFRPTLWNINKFFSTVYPNLKIYAYDNLDMTMTYVFGEPNEMIEDLITTTDIMPRPSTVGLKIKTVLNPHFGFGEHHLNFVGSFGE